MSSYVMEYQSRGVGAIASNDLGAAAKTAGQVTASPVQARSAASHPANNVSADSALSISSGARAYGQPSGPILSARVRRGSTASAFIPGATGRPLNPSPRLVDFAVSDQRYPILSRPMVTHHAGLMPGKPPATLVEEDDREEAELFVPTLESKFPWLLVLGGAAAVWYLARKTR